MLVKMALLLVVAVLLISGALTPAFSTATEWIADIASGWLTDTIEETQEDADRQRRQRERKERRRTDRP